jgi:hypothetical protein
MTLEVRPNFFTKAATAPAPTMAQVMFTNDPKYRRDYGMWLYERFNSLTDEYKLHGRFLTLSEINDPDSPLDF